MRKERLFILRLWRDGADEQDWRASIKDVRSEETQLFESLERLIDFIRTRVAQEESQPKS